MSKKTQTPSQANDKKAILLVTSGTTMIKARQVFNDIGAKVQKTWPEWEVHWGFTSRIIRQRLAAKGEATPSPAETLAALRARQFTQVAVQSLHVIPGGEFHDLVREINGFRQMDSDFKLSLGRPLCSTTDDLQQVCQAILKGLPRQRKPEEAVIFMGHGAKHPAGTIYLALSAMLNQLDPLVILSTLEGFPDFNLVAQKVVLQKVTRAYLMPFLTVAGRHAQRDMAGPGDETWETKLTKLGVETEPIIKAISENQMIVDIWLNHLQFAIDEFEAKNGLK